MPSAANIEVDRVAGAAIVVGVEEVAGDAGEAAIVEAILRLEYVASLSKVVGAIPIARLLLWELYDLLTSTPARLLSRCQLLAMLRLGLALVMLSVTINPVARARALVMRARTLPVFPEDFVVAIGR